MDFSTRTNTSLGLIDPKCVLSLGMEPLLPKKINSPPSRGSSSYQTQISVPKHTQEQLKRFLQNVLANREHKQIPVQRTPQQEPESQNNPIKTHKHTIPRSFGAIPTPGTGQDWTFLCPFGTMDTNPTFCSLWGAEKQQ